MKKPKRILWLIHEGQLTGANKCLLEWIKILSDNGYRQYVITPRLGEVTASLKMMGVPFTEIYYYSNTINPSEKRKLIEDIRKKLRNIAAKNKINKVVKNFKPDFIATNTITIDIGALVALQWNIKHVWFVHEFGDSDHGFSFAGGMIAKRQKIVDMSFKVGAISEAIAKDYRKINKDKIHLIFNSVELEGVVNKTAVTTNNNKELKLLMLGQVTPGKGQLEAVTAVNECKNLGLCISLHIYGSSENKYYLGQIIDYIEQNNLDNYVYVLDQITNIKPLLADSSALLVCSKKEAFGRVIVEALKMGVPVIAANTGATVEIVENDVNGLLYEQGNTQDLVKAIIKLKTEYAAFDSLVISQNAKAKFNALVSFNQLEKLFS